MRINASDVTVTRHHTDAWECAVMLSGYRFSQVYYGYGKREARRRFLALVRASR